MYSGLLLEEDCHSCTEVRTKSRDIVRDAGAAVGKGGAVKELRAMETDKKTKNPLPVVLASFQQRC